MAEQNVTTGQNTKEKPKRFSFERWKYTLAGSFWGMVFGIVWGVYSKNWVANNAFLNKHFTTGADLPDNIYGPRTVGMSALAGTVIGGCIDFVKDLRMPDVEKAPSAQPSIAPSPTEPLTEIVQENNNKLQEMLARKEAAKVAAELSGQSR